MPRLCRKFIIVVALVCAWVSACTPNMNSISIRNPDLFEKASDKMLGASRGVGDAPAPEVFVKQKKIALKEADRPNETGSLFNPDNERNYLFTQSGPQNVGRFLKINVASNHLGGKDKPGKDKAGKAGKGKDAGKDAAEAKTGKGGKDDKEDDVESELLKALPELASADKGEPALLKSFKMQIVHRFDNGDVLALLDRKSHTEDRVSETTVQARIPYDRLSSGDDLTTDDLLDVHMVQNHEGELVERDSSGWEDEYSLRLSGFSEAKSKMALELDDQRKKLKEADERVETKIKSFGEERRQFAKQRDELNQKKVQNDARVQTLEQRVQEQQSTIDSQKEQIDSQSEDAKAAGAPAAKAAKAPPAPKAKAPANA